VREIDGSAGVMGRATDRATISSSRIAHRQGRRLGPARAVPSHALPPCVAATWLEGFPTVELAAKGWWRDCSSMGSRAGGVETTDGRRFSARTVVVTAGTFLRGRIHMGTACKSRRPSGGSPAVDVAQHIEALGVTVSRFKTGTPPRVDGRSVDWSKVERPGRRRNRLPLLIL